MSSNNGQISHEQSTKVVNIIEDTKSKLENKANNQPKFENQKLIALDHIIRKNAHGFLYMVLAILVSASLFAYEKSGKYAIVYVLFICQFYAVTDEFHQSFVPGRTSLVSDVLVDFIGTLLGLIIFYIIYYKIYKSGLRTRLSIKKL
jgi:VanZ family protein